MSAPLRVCTQRTGLVTGCPVQPSIMNSTTSYTTTPITGPQFVTPVEVNAVALARIIIVGGTGNLYESTYPATTFTTISGTGSNRAAMIYGGRKSGVDNPDLIYATIGSQV